MPWTSIAELKGPKGDPGGPFNPVAITDGQDLNTLRTTGWYYCRLTTTAATVLNRPTGIGDGPFMIEVRSSPFNYTSQYFVGYSGPAAGVYARNTGNATGTAFTQWARLDNQTSTGTTGSGGGLANALRITDYTKRRGGPINTAGKGALALRFDHGLTNFKSEFLPLLRTAGFKSALALNSRTWTSAENSGATQSDVLSWVASDGVEVWNHGATHGDAADQAALNDEIVNGLAELRSQLPGVVIDGFAIPGVGGTNYGGFNGGATPEAFYATTAGQMILEHHAVSTGAFPGTAHRVMDGVVRQGQAHYSIEAQTVAQIKAQVDLAVTNKTGLQMMMHPSNLNASGYLTTAQFSEVVTYIKSKVDAGVLVVLSPYELMLANSGTATSARVTALETAKVTVDNTVGRRAFAWDSTNSRAQMVYGDTGIRDMTLLIPDRTSGTATIRRVGQTVMATFSDIKLNRVAGTTDLTSWLPAGFRSDQVNVQFMAIPNTAATTPRRINFATSSTWRIYGFDPTDSLIISTSWMTSDPWPAVLPGTAIGSIPNA